MKIVYNPLKKLRKSYFCHFKKQSHINWDVFEGIHCLFGDTINFIT